MYQLVIDVDSYYQFIPWCVSSKVLQFNDMEQVAVMEIAKGPIRKRIVTRNKVTHGESIRIELMEGPFRSFEGQWTFMPLGLDSCRVTLTLNFDFTTAITRRIVAPIFQDVTSRMVDEFCARAKFIYG